NPLLILRPFSVVYCLHVPVHNSSFFLEYTSLALFISAFFWIVSIITLTRLACECYICVIHVRVIHFPQAWRSIPCIWLSSVVWSGASLLGWNNHILDMRGPGCTGDWPSKDTSHSSFVLFLFLGCLMVSLLIFLLSMFLGPLSLLSLLLTLWPHLLVLFEGFFPLGLFILAFLLIHSLYTATRLIVLKGKFSYVTPQNKSFKGSIAFIMKNKAPELTLRSCMAISFFTHQCQTPAKHMSAFGREMCLRSIVMSKKKRDKPKQKVTFNSSSIIFITNDESLSVGNSDRTNGSKVDVIQVYPLQE
ncbi:hypothetical protein FD754_021441, partial [Muntiacus muntjak]